MKITTNIDEKLPWFGKFWPKNVPKQLTYDDSVIMYDLLASVAEENPDYNAIWFLETFVSYKRLKDMVDRFASGLIKLGLKKGDVIALVLPNSIQYVVAYYAANKLGIIPTGINPTYKAGEVLHQLQITGAEYIIILDVLYKNMLEPIRTDLNLKTVISTNVADLATGISAIKKFLGKKTGKIPSGQVPDSFKFRDMLKNKPDSPRANIDQENDPATYIMTGGTTGVPKAAVLTHINIYTNVLQCTEWFNNQPPPRFVEKGIEVGPRGCLVGVIPLFHSFAMTSVMNAAICNRAWMMLFPIPPKTKDLLETFNKLEINNGMIYPGAEILFQYIADFPEVDKYKNALEKLSNCISGAGPLHRHIQDKFETRTGVLIVEGYGLTETSPVVSIGTTEADERTVGTIGLPVPGTEWGIFQIDDFEAGPIKEYGKEKGAGEICVSGPQIMKGYLNELEQTDDTIKEWNGKKWLLTGDIGYMNEYGIITIFDRKKQLIKMKGYSVYPREVEELMGMHDDVAEVAVAGIPDPDTGEFIKAWVVVNPGANLTSDMMLEWCKDNLTHYKVPKEIDIRDAIPKNNIGKVLRRKLQEEDPRYQEAQKRKR